MDQFWQQILIAGILITFGGIAFRIMFTKISSLEINRANFFKEVNELTDKKIESHKKADDEKELLRTENRQLEFSNIHDKLDTMSDQHSRDMEDVKNTLGLIESKPGIVAHRPPQVYKADPPNGERRHGDR